MPTANRSNGTLISPPRAAILGTGFYVPERVLANADLESLVDTSDQWIVERTGIRERRIAADDETTSTMATIAGRLACEDAGVRPEDLDLIIVATLTPDYLTPATACLVQGELGADQAGAFDLEAACTGFIYGLSVAAGMVSSGMARHVLVIGADTLSRVVDYTDRGTCILFGDGAGAAVVGPSTSDAGVLYSRLRSHGEQAEMIQIPGGGSRYPSTQESVAARQHYLQIAGRQVFKFATNAFIELIHDCLEHCQLKHSDVALIVPHQVNERIIDAAMKRIEFPREKCFINIDRYGNTSGASVPIALHEARQAGRLKSGDIAILLGFGAGLTWGVSVVKM